MKSVVYKIVCRACNDKPYIYITETSRPVRERFNEHLSDTRLRWLSTGLGEHVLDRHPSFSHKNINNNFLINILSRNRDVADNKIDESMKIRDINPDLNTYTKS